MFKQEWMLLAALVPLSAWGGNSVGNGGGAWVCRGEDRQILPSTSQLVDLFEAENDEELGLTVDSDHFSGNVTQILDLAKMKILKANRDFAAGLEKYFKEVNDLRPVRRQIIHTDHRLPIVNDALYRLIPGDFFCPPGVQPEYEQVVNFHDNGVIRVQRQLYQSLSTLHQAALIVHEAVYAYRREHHGEAGDSRNTRQIVGLIFSTLTPEEVGKALEGVGIYLPVEMSFVTIRAGSFLMGSLNDERDRLFNEKLHLVQIIRDFEIQTTEVTQKQWFQVMGSNPSLFKKQENCPGTYQVIRGTALCPNHPVEQVSWEDVDHFIRVLNTTLRDGYLYRLPTEAEWEYAARAGTSTAYSFGGDANQLPLYAWYSGNSGRQTHEVAKLRANGWGLHDMHGNVWEWVSDFYRNYSEAGRVDPQRPRFGRSYVFRGGGWGDCARSLRSATRDRYLRPGAEIGDMNVGLRLVRTSLR